MCDKCPLVLDSNIEKITEDTMLALVTTNEKNDQYGSAIWWSPGWNHAMDQLK